MEKLKYLKVRCPFAVYLPRKTTKDKRIPINMNWYRNAQHFESNQVKKQFKALVASQLKDVELEVPVWVKYQVFKPSKRRLDKMNVASVTSKFVLDALSEFGVIPDDNDDYIKDEIILPTVHDKEDERVIVEFITVEEKDIG